MKHASVCDGHYNEYCTRLFHIGFGDFVTFSLQYRVAVDKHGRKSRTPFKHNSGGTYRYREYPVWRFGFGVLTKSF